MNVNFLGNENQFPDSGRSDCAVQEAVHDPQLPVVTHLANDPCSARADVHYLIIELELLAKTGRNLNIVTMT